MSDDEEKIPRSPGLPSSIAAPQISLKPDPVTGEAQVSVPPGTTITTKGPPPSAAAVLASLVPDLTAIAVFGAWGWHSPGTQQFAQASIMGVLALRLYSNRPGEEAKSGIVKGVELVARFLNRK